MCEKAPIAKSRADVLQGCTQRFKPGYIKAYAPSDNGKIAGLARENAGLMRRLFALWRDSDPDSQIGSNDEVENE